MLPQDAPRPIRIRRWRRTVLAAGAALLLTACGSTSGSGPEAGSGAPSSPDGVDDGTSLTMWTRAATQAQSEAFVAAYNAGHRNQIELTVIPTDDYQAKVGAAAGARNLPDLFAADVVYVPLYAEQGLFTDLTDRIAALPYADDLIPAHLDVGTVGDERFVVPHTIDTSVLFWNKALYRQAGLDPEAPPRTLAEYAEHARQIDALGGDINGTFYGGNCGGCALFTMWPSIWADGGDVLSPDGTQATLATPEAKGVLQVYRSMVADGLMAPGFRDETGATWTGVFPQGKTGLMPMPSTTIGLMPDDLDFGVAPIPGLDGGASTFVGGDAIGIAASSDASDAAWNFISWSLSEQAQLDVLAGGGSQVARTDLVDNPITAANPNLAAASAITAQGRTPKSQNFGQAFNDPNGPWLALVRDAILADGGRVDELNAAITDLLAQ